MIPRSSTRLIVVIPMSTPGWADHAYAAEIGHAMARACLVLVSDGSRSRACHKVAYLQHNNRPRKPCALA